MHYPNSLIDGRLVLASGFLECNLGLIMVPDGRVAPGESHPEALAEPTV